MHIPTAALYLLWRCLLYRVTLEWHRDPNAAVTAHPDVLARSLLTPTITPTAYYAYYTYSYYAYTYCLLHLHLLHLHLLHLLLTF